MWAQQKAEVAKAAAAKVEKGGHGGEASPAGKEVKPTPPDEEASAVVVVADGVAPEDSRAATAAAALAAKAESDQAVRTAQRTTSEKETKVEQELAKLKAAEQADICILREKLESADRDLDRDLKYKEQAYVTAKEAVEALQARKREMHEHLALMVLSSAKRKEEKLTELMGKMGCCDAGLLDPLAEAPRATTR